MSFWTSLKPRWSHGQYPTFETKNKSRQTFEIVKLQVRFGTAQVSVQFIAYGTFSESANIGAAFFEQHAIVIKRTTPWKDRDYDCIPGVERPLSATIYKFLQKTLPTAGLSQDHPQCFECFRKVSSPPTPKSGPPSSLPRLVLPYVIQIFSLRKEIKRSGQWLPMRHSKLIISNIAACSKFGHEPKGRIDAAVSGTYQPNAARC